MKIEVSESPPLANAAAAADLARSLLSPEARSLVVAGGNTPLELYRLIAGRSLSLGRLHIFVLDEYAGVPLEDPRTCTNLLRRTVQEAWKIPPEHFHPLSSLEKEALASVRDEERRIAALGGPDLAVLGIGPNGHLGFNEPGSPADSAARLVDLEPSSVEANRRWFGGEHAPARGATLGLKTILAAKHILLLAYGSSKAEAVKKMVDGPRSERCPASWLQGHPEVKVFLDRAAAARLQG